MISENQFVYKSLSNWTLNTAVGCDHACRFCYVPSTATIKQAGALQGFGVSDPDAEWAENVERIEAHARSLGVKLNTAVFASREAWRAYSVAQLKLV